MQMPDDEVMRGFLISLGFHKPTQSQEIPTPDDHEKLVPDHAFERRQYKTVKDSYDPNKRGVSLAIEQTSDRMGVYVKDFVFSKKGVEAGLTIHDIVQGAPNPDEKFNTIPSSNQKGLEKSIQRALSRLPKDNVPQKLNAVYTQLLEYAK